MSMCQLNVLDPMNPLPHEKKRKEAHDLNNKDFRGYEQD
jgi:hypothetical protein